MNMIKLHNANGEEFWLNPSFIQAMNKQVKNDGAQIWMNNGDELFVKESVADILLSLTPAKQRFSGSPL